jgi:hypothetical protein
MNAESPEVRHRIKPPGPLGLYLIIAYCMLTLVQFPFQFPLPKQFFLGPFLLGGVGVLVALVTSAVLWVAITIGLVLRRSWAHVLALVVFGVHSLLLTAGAIRWLTNWTDALAAYRQYAGPGDYLLTPRAIFQIMVAPTLALLVPSALAFLYLMRRRDLFVNHKTRDVVVA